MWKWVKKGKIECKRKKDGTYVVVREVDSLKMGRRPKYTREDILNQVYKLCKGRYVKATDFPHNLYKLIMSKQYNIGSIRAAKWEAKILHGKRWSYDKFLKCVKQFCNKRYKAEKDWPENMRGLAEHFCGTIRRAKWEAGIIVDKRQKERQSYSTKKWNKENFLEWVTEYCKDRYRKNREFPGYMRRLALLYFDSVRHAKLMAKILVDQRKNNRRPHPK